MPRLPRNARLFVWFRVLFNARFYYPVLAVFFVDLGLTLEQYTILNVAWALSIVLLELPLGALGDQIGRKPLVVTAAAIMVVEMAVLAFWDSDSAQVLFWVFLFNRVLSGAAEAAASGADEALAYDTMVDADRRGDWPHVLTALGRAMSVAMFVAMVVGGLVYDPDVIRGVLGSELDQRTTARFPVYLCLLTAIGALVTSLCMREERDGEDGTKLAESLRGIGKAARWIAATPFALGIILFFLFLDSVVRLFLTVSSTYFRLHDIPEGLFGVLGACLSLLGFVAPSIARALLPRAAVFNFSLTTVVMLAGLIGLALAGGWFGVAFVFLLGIGYHLLSFFVSHYLNDATESKQRATVLSFKSLAGNLAYGLVGWFFALLLRHLAGGEAPEPNSAEEASVFATALVWIPVYFAATTIPLIAWSFRSKRMCTPGG